jgi:hypothetical protein
MTLALSYATLIPAPSVHLVPDVLVVRGCNFILQVHFLVLFEVTNWMGSAGESDWRRFKDEACNTPPATALSVMGLPRTLSTFLICFTRRTSTSSNLKPFLTLSKSLLLRMVLWTPVSVTNLILDSELSSSRFNCQVYCYALHTSTLAVAHELLLVSYLLCGPLLMPFALGA